MANLYHNWGPKQRKRWNEYSKEYSKNHFKTITVKLRLVEDKDIINYLNANKQTSATELVRTSLRHYIKNKIGE